MKLKTSTDKPRLIELKYDNACHFCGYDLEKGEQGYWLPDIRRVICVDCKEEEELMGVE